MKRSFIILSFLIFTSAPGFTQTLKGGWIQVEFDSYDVVTKLFYYDLTLYTYGRPSGGRLLEFWDGATGLPVERRGASPAFDTLTKFSNQFSDCINTSSLNNPYTIFYEHLPSFVTSSVVNGFSVTTSYEGRDAAIKNIYDPETTGMMLRTNIAGTINGKDYHINYNPYIDFRDTISACINSYFSYQVTAWDRDKDSLSYSFGDAINTSIDSTVIHDNPVRYKPGFSGTNPLGTGASINPVTGVISGIAPAEPGYYLIAVYAQEWRKGVLINTTRKESEIKVVYCPFAAPLLKPLYKSCRNFTFTFKNEPTCPAIEKWFWDFGDPSSTTDTSSLANPTYTYPSVPGTYTLTLRVANKDGYIDSATSTVKIFDSIPVSIIADTAICKKDTITLRPVSNGSAFYWRESGTASTLSNKNIQNPKAFPSADSTVYYVIAQLDKCKDSTKIKVYASPYPSANAGIDTFICFSGGVALHAAISGSSFTWSPANTLTNYNTLQPVAHPLATTSYKLTVKDTFYCPKPVSDSVTVTFIPRFAISAGNDKLVASGYPFPMNASGDTNKLSYQWQPSLYLTNSKVHNPVGIVQTTPPAVIRFTVKASNSYGCFATDDVLVKVFNTGPDILVPAAFTPNGDGKNEILKPILIGIDKLYFFNVFNRFGQMVYSTSEADKGWDGKVKEQQQQAGAYIFITKGKDFSGKIIEKNGTVLLIR